MDIAVRRRNPGSRMLHGFGRGLHRGNQGFRSFRKARPFWAGLWAMLGGALISFVMSSAFKFTIAPQSLASVGMIVGILIGVFGLFVWLQQQLRYVLGVTIVLLSLFSFIVADFGGYLVGMIMGILGGSLAVGWMPNPPLSWRERRRARRAAARLAANESGAVELVGRPTSSSVPAPIDKAEAVGHADAASELTDGRRFGFLSRRGR